MPDLEAPKRYPPVGRCIYCGRDDLPLTDEHIVPYGLGGQVILPDASCKPCAHITGAVVERQCLRNMLGPARIHLGLPTRNKKDRPKTSLLTVEYGDRHETVELPYAEIPRAFSLLMLSYPTLLFGIGQDHSGLVHGTKLWTAQVKEDFAAQAARHPRATRIIRRAGSINAFIFARMLAKIAHAFAVAEYGYGRFPHLLPDLILGRQRGDGFNHLVGGTTDILPKGRNTHEIRLERHSSVLGEQFLVARIRLFADLGGPIYFVVVGPSSTLGAPTRAQPAKT